MPSTAPWICTSCFEPGVDPGLGHRRGVLHDLVEQLHADRVVGDRRRGDHHRDDQTQGVHGQAPLTARHLLCAASLPVVAAGTWFAALIDWVSRHRPRTGPLGGRPSPAPDSAADHESPGRCRHRATRRSSSTSRTSAAGRAVGTPTGSRSGLVEDRVHDLPEPSDLARTECRSFQRVQERSDNRPLLIGTSHSDTAAAGTHTSPTPGSPRAGPTTTHFTSPSI